MEIVKLHADPRNEHGKGASSRLRRAGRIPAVAYGKELPTTAVAVSPKELAGILRSEHGQNSVIELDIDGKEKVNVMVREYAYHPVTRELMHADFYQVRMDQPVEVDVPLKLVGKAKGETTGGRVQQIFRTVPVRSLPANIPAVLELDVTELDLHDTLKASQIKLEGVSVLLPDNQTVVVVNAPEKVTEETTEGAAEGGEAAAAAAPAAEDKDKDKK
jgi:large subunit ribosomal protein L25